MQCLIIFSSAPGRPIVVVEEGGANQRDSHVSCPPSFPYAIQRLIRTEFRGDERTSNFLNDSLLVELSAFIFSLELFRVFPKVGWCWI